MLEVWKQIEGTTDCQISNFGNIRNSNGYLKSRADKDGYRIIDVHFSGKKKTMKVHRLVATAFIPNPENKPCVNHIDGNKQNNSVENLEWCTHSENMKHAFKTGLWKSPKAYLGKFGKEHNKSVSVQCVETGIVYGSIHEASRMTGANVTSIWRCCKNLAKLANGFHWKYAGGD